MSKNYIYINAAGKSTVNVFFWVISEGYKLIGIVKEWNNAVEQGPYDHLFVVDAAQKDHGFGIQKQIEMCTSTTLLDRRSIVPFLWW